MATKPSRRWVTALRAQGCIADLWIAPTADQLKSLACEARDRKPDAVLACGGDGTVNAVAGALVGSDVPLGIVPLGTFNYVAQHYGIPQAADQLALALLNGAPLAIGAGRINGHLFLNNASFGLYTDIIDARERHKAQWGRYRLVALVSALATALRSRARLPLQIRGESHRLLFSGRASLVFIGVNPSQLQHAGLTATAAAVSRGSLGLVLARSIKAWRLLGMLVGAATGRLAELDEIEPVTGSAFSIDIRQRRRSVRVVIDGETLRLKPPLKLDYLPRALHLLVPAGITPANRALIAVFRCGQLHSERFDSRVGQGCNPLTLGSHWCLFGLPPMMVMLH